MGNRIIKSFASDNNSGVHPNVMQALVDANKGHALPYAADEITIQAEKVICETLGAKSAFFTLNGTGTNICIMDALTNKYGAILCTDLCHMFVHESGAPAKVSGNQLLSVPSEDGKLNVDLLDKYLQNKNDFHFPNPQIISIAQSTEMGAIYSVEEIKKIVTYARRNGYKVHLDGARISNACAKLGLSLKEMSADLGIDALSFGMCKNGLMFGECAVFFDDKHDDFMHYIKSNLQLQSKSRYVGAQYLAILKDNLWFENAKNANDMCEYFYKELSKVDGIKLVNKPDSNILFAEFPRKIISDLQAYMSFCVENEQKNYSRLVCSYDTTKNDIDGFVNKLKSLLEEN